MNISLLNAIITQELIKYQCFFYQILNPRNDYIIIYKLYFISASSEADMLCTSGKSMKLYIQKFSSMLSSKVERAKFANELSPPLSKIVNLRRE